MGLRRRIADRFFRREDIGDPAGGLYLERWVLLRLFGCSLYLHRFVRSDWTRDLHDHPRSFFTLPLRGGYRDETQPGRMDHGGGVIPLGLNDFPRAHRLVRWPWPRFRRAEHRHRVELDPRWPHPVTLVLMLRARREWGFWTERGFIHWRIYTAPPSAGPQP